MRSRRESRVLTRRYISPASMGELRSLLTMNAESFTTATAATLPVDAQRSTSRWAHTHHGLYVGQGCARHCAGFERRWRRGRVEEVTLDAFTRGKALTVQPWRGRELPPALRVARVRLRPGEHRYPRRSNNCEHFLQCCVFGVSRRAQVQAWTRRPGWAACVNAGFFGDVFRSGPAPLSWSSGA